MMKQSKVQNKFFSDKWYIHDWEVILYYVTFLLKVNNKKKKKKRKKRKLNFSTMENIYGINLCAPSTIHHPPIHYMIVLFGHIVKHSNSKQQEPKLSYCLSGSTNICM